MQPDHVPYEKVAVVYRTAWRVARRLTGDTHLSEDVAQEASIRALVRWERVTGFEEPWATRVASNLVIDLWRKGSRLQSTDGEDPGGPEAAVASSRVSVAESVALNLDLRVALLQLPTKQRTAVVLRYLLDLPQANAAEIMNCSVGAVSQHTARGLAALRRTLGPEYAQSLERSVTP